MRSWGKANRAKRLLFTFRRACFILACFHNISLSHQNELVTIT